MDICFSTFDTLQGLNWDRKLLKKESNSFHIFTSRHLLISYILSILTHLLIVFSDYHSHSDCFSFIMCHLIDIYIIS